MFGQALQKASQIAEQINKTNTPEHETGVQEILEKYPWLTKQ